LAHALEPLDPTLTTYLVDRAVERDGAGLATRLDRVADALELAAPAGGASRPRADALAALAEPLDAAASLLLSMPDAGIGRESLTAHVGLAASAWLARGDADRAARLLDESLATLEKGRIGPEDLVEVADAICAGAPSLDALRERLVRAYRIAGYKLIERLPQTQLELLAVVARQLEWLQSGEENNLRDFWREYAGEQVDVAPQAVENPKLLAGKRVAIAGADAATRHRAAEELRDRGAEVVEVPPAYEVVLNEDQVRQRLAGAHVVAEVWRRTKHQTSHAVQVALERLDPAPAHKPVPGSGSTSIVGTVLAWARAAT
jgi:hypothetical protein